MSAANGDVLLDAHVHYHAGFSRDVFFEAARNNLRAGGRRAGIAQPAALGLMLTESSGVDAFGELAAQAIDADADADAGGAAEASQADAVAEPRPRVASGDWRVRATSEDNSLWAERPSDGAELLLIAGRQLVTREKLEVLALGCRTELPDGMALREARDAVIEANGIAVIPWGFGKWWSKRGRLVRELIDADSPARWYLGDNAGRPRLSRRPPLFARAARRGVFVLPGSDPLPLPYQERKVGRCGFVLPRRLDRERPAASVLAWLRDTDEQPATFGGYESLARFARDQVAMQMRKRGTDTGTDPRTDPQGTDSEASDT